MSDSSRANYRMVKILASHNCIAYKTKHTCRIVNDFSAKKTSAMPLPTDRVNESNKVRSGFM